MVPVLPAWSWNSSSSPKRVTAVWLTMLPSVEVRSTLPPRILPLVLVMSPRVVTSMVFATSIVPPVLLSVSPLIAMLSTTMFAPSSPARVALDRYTTGASTVWPLTSVSTIHTMSCFSALTCSCVSATP